MKVVIYIGHHKVGSTALQMFLAQNWLGLVRAGILYPSVESRGFSQNLSRALAGRDRAGQNDVNIREPHSALAYRMMSEVSKREVPAQFRFLPGVAQMIQAIRNQVRILKPDTLVLCSEAFANFGQVNPALIRRLGNIFPKAEIEIYCALRRPDDYLVSWHGQRLKVGEKLDSLSNGGTEPYFDTIHFNFRTVIEGWAREMPRARLIVRNYADILAAGGSTQDFMEQTGVTYPEGLIPVGRANTSLPRAAMEIVRRANRELPPEQAHALCRYLLDGAQGLEPVPNERVEMFGARPRAIMAERFAPVQAYLSDLTGQRAFFPDMDEVARTRPVPEAEAVAGLLAQMDPAALPGGEVRAFVAGLRPVPAG